MYTSARVVMRQGDSVNAVAVLIISLDENVVRIDGQWTQFARVDRHREDRSETRSRPSSDDSESMRLSDVMHLRAVFPGSQWLEAVVLNSFCIRMGYLQGGLVIRESI